MKKITIRHSARSLRIDENHGEKEDNGYTVMQPITRNDDLDSTNYRTFTVLVPSTSATRITKKLTTKADSNRILNLYSVMGLHASKIKGSVVLCGVV